jgi:hypothetical protein
MGPNKISVKLRHAIVWAVTGALLAASIARAQNEPSPHQHIYLPPTYGATPLSTIIHAQAAYVASLGDYLESEAIARRHHALAVEQEIRNHVQWVTSFFELRELNRTYQLKENPPYLDKEELRHRQAKRRIVDDPYLAAQGDPTRDLNWLLEELSAMWLAYKYLPLEESLADSKIDHHLLPEDIRHIRLMDGSQTGRHMFEFRADDPKPLETQWPVALRGAEFDELRKQFETARDAALKEAASEAGLSRETHTRLKDAVEALNHKFQEENPPQRRTESWSSSYVVYAAGNRFLQRLAGGVYRLAEVNDTRMFDKSYRFEGDSVVDLIDHLYSRGLQFAQPESGDEGTYKKLFHDLRHLYVNLLSRQPQPPAQAEAAAKGP